MVENFKSRSFHFLEEDHKNDQKSRFVTAQNRRLGQSAVYVIRQKKRFVSGDPAGLGSIPAGLKIFGKHFFYIFF